MQTARVGERNCLRQQLIEHHAQGINITCSAVRRGLSAKLFGGHVFRRTHQLAGATECALFVQQACESKIRQSRNQHRRVRRNCCSIISLICRVAVNSLQQDVIGFDIAMHNMAIVSMLNRVG